MNFEFIKRNSFLKKIFIYFIGTFSTKMLSILLIPIYAYFVLAKDLGEYDYIIAITNILVPIVYFVVWESILRFCIQKKDDENEVNKVLSASILIYCVMTALLAVVFITISLLKRNSLFTIMLLCTVVQGATSLWQFSARALKKNKDYVRASVIGCVTLLLCDVGFILFLKLDYFALSIAHIMSQFFVFAYLEYKVKIIKRIKLFYVRKEDIRAVLMFSIPLVINNVSLWFYNSGSKVIIRNYVGSTENGLYSFASKFSILISLMSTVISMAVIEEAYSYKTIEEYKIKISKLISVISKVYFSLITLALPAIYILYSIAFKRTAYYDSSNYVFLLLLAALFTSLSNNFGSSFQITNNTKYISITTISGAIVALGVSIGLVQIMGVYGVLIGGTLGPFIMMLTRALYAYKATGLSINWKGNSLTFLVGLGEYALLLLVENIIIQIICFIIAFVFALFQYRNEISLLFNRIKVQR